MQNIWNVNGQIWECSNCSFSVNQSEKGFVQTTLSHGESHLSKCCKAGLITDLNPEKNHYWSEVAHAPLVCEVCGERQKAKSKKDFEILYWANGFGVWHAKAVFAVPLGNTWEAEKVFLRAEKKAKQVIRREIQARMNDKVRRLAYKITENKELGTGQLVSITWAEA